MNRIKLFFNKLWQDESGQGATEYILILAVVVILVGIFRNDIKGHIKGAVENFGGKLKAGLDAQ